MVGSLSPQLQHAFIVVRIQKSHGVAENRDSIILQPEIVESKGILSL